MIPANDQTTAAGLRERLARRGKADAGADKSRPARPSTAAEVPLEDDDLVARLADALSQEPRRTSAGAPDTKGDPIREAITPAEPPAPAPFRLPGEDETSDLPAARTSLAAKAWLQRRRRQRWSAALKPAPAWVVTLVVILATVSAGFVVAAGPDTAVKAVQAARTAADAAGSHVQTLIAKLRDLR